jgi:GH24 family phage-related lysozyme (muramidase)
MYVPEHAFAILVKRARCDHARDIGSGHPHPVAPSVRNGCVSPDPFNMGQGNFKSALKCPKRINPFDMQHQLTVCDRYIDHKETPMSQLYAPLIN